MHEPSTCPRPGVEPGRHRRRPGGAEPGAARRARAAAGGGDGVRCPRRPSSTSRATRARWRCRSAACSCCERLQRLGCRARAADPRGACVAAAAELGPFGEPELRIRAVDEAVPMLGAVLSYGHIVAPLQAAWMAACAREPERLRSRFGTPVAALKEPLGARRGRRRHRRALRSRGGRRGRRVRRSGAQGDRARLPADGLGRAGHDRRRRRRVRPSSASRARARRRCCR